MVARHDRREVTVRAPDVTLLLLPGALVTILAGCVAPALRSSAPLSSHSVNIATEPANAIRVRGRCEIAASQPPVANGALIVRVDAGQCQLTHLGTVRVEVEQQINVVLGTQSAQITLTTTDGARVRLSAVGDSDGRGDSVRFNGAARVVGGTGRFGSTTGAVRTEGITMSGDRRGGRSGSAVLKIDGWIAYQGAEPSGAAQGNGR